MLRVLAEKHGSPEARTVLDYAEVDPYATPKLGWEKVKGTFQAAADFAAAIKSRGLSDRRVDLSLRVIRDQSCFAEPCPSVRLAEDGVHHFCAACGCGDREIAHLDGDDYPKLDYPDLKCPRRRPGFSNSLDPVVVNAFDQVVCINLTRRRDRWDAFAAGIREMDWPFRPVKRFAAVDGHAEPPPKSWKAGKGAWGCMESHRRVLDAAIKSGAKSLLVLEDDAYFLPGFERKVAEFLKAVPDDWEGLMLGGQHTRQVKTPPREIEPGIVKCGNCQRTHAYAVRGPYMETLLRAFMAGNDHCDRAMGSLHAAHRVYAPSSWLVGQDESKSDIFGKMMPKRLWTRPESAKPFYIFDHRTSRDAIERARLRTHHFGYAVGPGGVDQNLDELLRAEHKPGQFRVRAFAWERLVAWEGESMANPIPSAAWHPDPAMAEKLKAMAKHFGPRAVHTVLSPEGACA